MREPVRIGVRETDGGVGASMSSGTETGSGAAEGAIQVAWRTVRDPKETGRSEGERKGLSDGYSGFYRLVEEEG